MTHEEMAKALDKLEAQCVQMQSAISRVRYAIEDRHIGRRVGLDYDKVEAQREAELIAKLVAKS